MIDSLRLLRIDELSRLSPAAGFLYESGNPD